MQISGSNVGLLSSSADAQTGKNIAGQAAQGVIAPVTDSSPQTGKSAEASPDSANSDAVFISSATDATSGHAPAPVYAEIWKGSVKIAQVDIYGHITSSAGMLIAGSAGGGGGPIAAAQRAVQVAQQTGGEVRVAGAAINNQTLLTRARLASAYAV